MNVREVDYFNSKLALGSTYRITDFMCEPTNPYQQTIDNPTSLKFGKITKFENIITPKIPFHYFKFVPYNQLHSKVARQNAAGKMEYPMLTGNF